MPKATSNLLKPITLALVIGLLAAGCATGKRGDAVDTNGRHKIDCSGIMKSWDDCYEEASAICGENRYDILWGSSRFGALRRITIECREQERLTVPTIKRPPA